MKKLLFSLFMSFVFLYFIWCMIIWIENPDFIQNSSHYHLDLYAMFNRFNVNSTDSTNFINTFKSFIDNVSKLNMNNPFIQALFSGLGKTPLSDSSTFFVIINVLNALINPIYAIFNAIIVLGYLIALFVQLLSFMVVIAYAIFDFVFSPVIIYV